MSLPDGHQDEYVSSSAGSDLANIARIALEANLQQSPVIRRVAADANAVSVAWCPTDRNGPGAGDTILAPFANAHAAVEAVCHWFR